MTIGTLVLLTRDRLCPIMATMMSNTIIGFFAGIGIVAILDTVFELGSRLISRIKESR